MRRAPRSGRAGPPTGFSAPRTIGTRPYPGWRDRGGHRPGRRLDRRVGRAPRGSRSAADAGPPALLTHGSPPSTIALSMAPDGSAAIVWDGVRHAAAGRRDGAPRGGRSARRRPRAPRTCSRATAASSRSGTAASRAATGASTTRSRPRAGGWARRRRCPRRRARCSPQLIARPSLAADQRGDVFLDYLTAPQSSPPLNSQLAGALMAAGRARSARRRSSRARRSRQRVEHPPPLLLGLALLRSRRRRRDLRVRHADGVADERRERHGERPSRRPPPRARSGSRRARARR